MILKINRLIRDEVLFYDWTHLHVTQLCDQDILRFEITINEPQFMDRIQCCHYFTDDESVEVILLLLLLLL